jgi:hypothetical protein
MSEEERDRPKEKPANTAPDAVKDPNEKTEGKPGLGPQGGGGKEADPGGS